MSTILSMFYDIIHEGIPLDNFESDFLKEPYISWNPPIRNTLTAVGKDDIDDQFDFDDNETLSQTDNDDNSFVKADSHTGDVTMTPVEDFLQVNGDSPRHDEADAPTGNVTITPAEEFLQVNSDRLQHDTDDDVTMKPVEDFLQVNSDNAAMTPVEEFLQGDGNPQKVVIPKGVSKIMELTLDQFENKYQLFAQKLVNINTGLVIRAILLKNNEVIFNYSFKIIGTDNVQNATIAAANKVCNIYLVCALKGDTLICSLGADHNGVCVSITRNVHIAYFIVTLNKIYIIVTDLTLYHTTYPRAPYTCVGSDIALR